MTVSDNKDAYSFLYPFGWQWQVYILSSLPFQTQWHLQRLAHNVVCWYQEVVIEGQDKVYKDVIEPLESVSVNLIPTSKQTIKDFVPP